MVLLSFVGLPLDVEGLVVFASVKEHPFELGNAMGMSINGGEAEFAEKGVAVIIGDEAEFADKGVAGISDDEAEVIDTGGAGLLLDNLKLLSILLLLDLIDRPKGILWCINIFYG